MRPFRRVTLVNLLLFAVAILSILPVSAQETKRPNFTLGPQNIRLGESQGQFNLPQGFVFVGPEDSRKMLERNGDTDNDDVLGIVSQDQGGVDWFGIFRYADSGYIKDDEADKMDANKLLNEIKAGTAEANVERRKQGLGELDVVGWYQPPTYDRQKHTLSWSVIGQERGDPSPVINYTTVLLGRYGILICTIVGDQKDGRQLQQNLAIVNASVNFPMGRDYPSFRQGDRISELTMTGLVTGGAAAAAYGAAKVGLMAKAGKLLIGLFLVAKKGIIVLVMGIGAAIKGLAAKFGKRSGDA
jgi:uncharacterized membrane-anchored protein